jgi:glutamyl/glutaminyl-tRNA synthetase
MGVENTRMKEGMTNINNNSTSPEPLEDENVDLQSLNSSYMNNKTVEEYYKNLIPNYNQSQSQYKPPASNYNRPYYSQQTLSSPSSESDNYKMLTDKLNYMINLLEEQQDEKTNNVTEEVVLYSFLGIFIIFVVDSFARVGKYVR